MRKGKYFRYKILLLRHLVKNNFLVEFDDVYLGSLTLSGKLKIPTSSWYDIIRDLHVSELILLKYKKQYIGQKIIDKIIRIQISKKGLDYLTRIDRHEIKDDLPS